MLVHQILRSKPTEGVLTIGPEATVAQAVTLLAEKRVGAVVVVPDSDVAPLGILSERDVVRALARHGDGALERPVSDLMTPEVFTCTPQDSADRVLQLMTERRFRHLPVMQDGRMAGLISIGDVVKARLSELAMEKDALEGMITGH